MVFFLTILKISYVLDPNLPKILAPTLEDSDEVKTQAKTKGGKLFCRGHSLNTLCNHLYDLFTSIKSLR